MKKFYLVLIFLLTALTSFSQSKLYVTETGNGTEDGSSWDNALPGVHLQDAINQLYSETQQNAVYVAAGTYTPTMTLWGNTDTDSTRYFTFSMRKGVAVYGSFEGSGNDDPAMRAKTDLDENGCEEGWEFENMSILSGELQNDSDSSNNALHVVHFLYCDTLKSTLDGFTVSGGFCDTVELKSFHTTSYVYASGIFSLYGIIKNCQIKNCYTNNTCPAIPDATERMVHIYGSGLFARGSILNSVKISDCNAHANRAFGTLVGGGAYIYECDFLNSVVDNCSATTLDGYLYLGRLTSYAGGVYFLKSNIDNCQIKNCTNINRHRGGYDYPLAGGAYIRACRVTNSVFTNNLAKASHDVALGGGVIICLYHTDIYPNAGMFNCLIANNTCHGKSLARGGGISMSTYDVDKWLPVPFANNTIVNNHLTADAGTNLYGSGIDISNGYWHRQSPVTIHNCLIWGNRKSAGVTNDQFNTIATSTVLNNAIENYSHAETSNINLIASNDDTGSGKVPYFMNPTSFAGYTNDSEELAGLDEAIWWIEEESDCLDMGTADTSGLMIPETAFYGNKRIYGEKIDIGAAEYALYTVNASADGGGGITPEGDTTVNIFAEIDFTVDHLESHSISSVEFSGNGILSADDNIYTLSSVSSDGNLTVQTAILTYTLTATAGANGSVDPTSVVVDHGSDQNFTIDPDDNYEIDAITFRGADVKDDVTPSGDNFEYTATAVMSDGVLDVTFKETVGIDPNSANKLSIYPNPAKTHLYLSSTDNITAEIEIFSITGNRVLVTTPKDKINISTLTQGVYFIKLKHKNNTQIRKFVKE